MRPDFLLNIPVFYVLGDYFFVGRCLFFLAIFSARVSQANVSVDDEIGKKKSRNPFRSIKVSFFLKKKHTVWIWNPSRFSKNPNCLWGPELGAKQAGISLHHR